MSATRQPKCPKGYLCIIHLRNGKISSRLAYCERWDCPRCGLERLGDRTEHVVATVPEFTFQYEECSPRTTSDRAKRANAGYMAISWADQSPRLIVSTPQFIPSAEVYQPFDMVLYCYDLNLDHGIARISFNTPWTPPDKSVNFHSFMTTAQSRENVEKAVERAGFVGRYSSVNPHIAQQMILEALDEGDPGEWQYGT